MYTGEWTIVDTSGASAISFSSFLDIDQKSTADTLTYPIEEGSFASYNKIMKPKELTVTLATQGDESLFDFMLAQLEYYTNSAIVLSVMTPAAFYDNQTLTSYNYRRSQTDGAGLLIVTLNFIEVKSVHNQVSGSGISSPKNPTSASTVNRGQVQTSEYTL